MRSLITTVHPPSPSDTPTDTSFQGMEEDPSLRSHPQSCQLHLPRTKITVQTNTIPDEGAEWDNSRKASPLLCPPSLLTKDSNQKAS